MAVLISDGMVPGSHPIGVRDMVKVHWSGKVYVTGTPSAAGKPGPLALLTDAVIDFPDTLITVSTRTNHWAWKEIFEKLWDANVQPVVNHHSNWAAYTDRPPYLYLPVTVSSGTEQQVHEDNLPGSFGPGLEVVTLATIPGQSGSSSFATPIIAGLLGALYELTDTSLPKQQRFFTARAALRKLATRYSDGWTPHRGWGWIDPEMTTPTSLDFEPQPPLMCDIARNSNIFTFNWIDFRADGFSETRIYANDMQIFAGSGGHFQWTYNQKSGTVTFRFVTVHTDGSESADERFSLQQFNISSAGPPDDR